MENFEGLIEELGGMGTFQVATLFWISLCQVTMGWSMLQMSYIGIVPDFTCVLPSGGLTSTGNNITLMNHCPSDDSDVMCSDYEFKGQINTLTEEFGLVCEKIWIKKTIISCQMAGVMVGVLLAGQAGDLFGRKKSLYSFVFVHIGLNIAAAFSSNWILFTVFRFGLGVTIGAIIILVAAYPIEFLSVKWRPILGIIPSWTIGVAIFSGTAFLLKNWVFLHIACAVASVPSLLGWFFVPESIRWLALKGKITEAEDVVVKIAKKNNKSLPRYTKSVLEKIMNTEREKKSVAKKYSYIDVLRGWPTFKRTSLLFYIWFTMSLSFYGISFGVGSLFGSIYLNIFLLGVLEIPVQCSTFFLQNRLGRRNSAIFFFVLTCLTCCGCIVIHFYASADDRGLAIRVLSLLAKVLVGCAWSCMQVWTSELYPTVTRSLGVAFTNVGARVGGILAPYAIDLQYQVTLSYSLMAGLYLVCAGVSVLLEETKGVGLKDSLDRKDDKCTEEFNVQVSKDDKPQDGKALSGLKGFDNFGVADLNDEKSPYLSYRL